MQSNYRKCEHRHFIDFLLQPILIFELLSLRPRELRSKTGGQEGGLLGTGFGFRIVGSSIDNLERPKLLCGLDCQDTGFLFGFSY